MQSNFSRAFVIIGIVLAAHPSFADVRVGYKTPLFTIPFASTPPKIDGVVNDDEWQNAFSINGVQTTEGKVSARQTRVWMCWDADHVYLAMRSPLRDGERVMQAFRQTGRDNSKVVFDDSYEIWLNADTQSPDTPNAAGERVFFQYLGNAAGAKYDVMFEPLVGNSRPGWESGWKPINRITPDGKSWEMEVAIPRESIYRNTPFEDGEQLHGLFVRNFKRPWEQNSIGGSGSFSVPETHCTFVLSKNAPAIHLLGIADTDKKTFGISLAACGFANQPLSWSFDSDGGTHTTGNTQQATSNLQLDKPGDGNYRIQITSSDQSKTYLDWSSHRAFGDLSATTQPVEKIESPKLNLTFNPVKNYVRVEGDFIDDDERASIARYHAEVIDSSGKTLADQELHLDNLAYVNGLLNLGDCPAGGYTARLTGFDATGKQVFRKESAFTKKDPAKEFPWWNTTAGDIEKVIAPWTPMQHGKDKAGADTIDVWGRSIQIGAAGLPAQITTQNIPMLAGPIELIADEKPAGVAKLETESESDHRVIVNADSSVGDIQIASKVTTEFDGLYKVQMTLSPKKGTSLNSLKIVVPLKPEFAQYCHACGEGIRYGFSYGYLPQDKTGQLWSSKQVDGQPMLVGSFIPYVWVGNDVGGLGWMADSDEGWSPSDKIPAIEIRRDSKDHVDLILNLIGEPSTLDKPRTITFAFQATPVKPLRDGWRMDTWSTGDSFKDWCRVEPRGGHLIWNALPFTLDPAACKKMVQERQVQTSEYNFGIKKYHINAVPYFENNQIDKKFAPAVEYFGDQWHTSVTDSLCYDKTLSDFIVWNLGQWCEQTGIDGWYVDNVRPVACDNIDAGRGYRLPDGRIQPTYQMFATREFFMRVRAVFAEHNKTGKFVLHMTNHMIMPWLAACDLALDGEDHVTFPEMGKDFIDFWSPARMRLDYPRPMGVAVTFLEEYQGNWKPDDLKRVTRAYTAMSILNDVMPGANPNGKNQEVWRGRDRFGLEAADVTFVPFWDKESGVSCESADVSASLWKKPGSVLIAVVNRGEATTASMHVDSKKFGLPVLENCEVLDADTGESDQKFVSDGSIQIPVPRHDYRQILIRARN